MGVMSCSRYGCESIMCDLYSSDYGYICYDCYQELCARPQTIQGFMESYKSGKDDHEMHGHLEKVKRVFQDTSECDNREEF